MTPSITLPRGAERILARLEEAGFESYAVGGGVRDALLGHAAQDWDLCTQARPEEVHAIFPDLPVLDTGLRHGTVTLLPGDGRYEVTAFRVDGAYTDHRRPDGVTFTRSIREDLARRDFTVNAVAYSPRRGLVDPFGGQADLARGLLRAVGEPEARFREDALRILRGLRFAACLGFSIEPETARAMRDCRELLRDLAPERVWEELWRLLPGENAVPVLREYRDIFAVVLPEIAPMFDFDQENKHHIFDVWEHTLHTMSAAPREAGMQLTMLLHDCGKPLTFTHDKWGDGHFYGHAAAGAARAEEALTRLRAPRALRETVVRRIALHDNDVYVSRPSILRWLRKLGAEEFFALLAVKTADNRAQSPAYDRTVRFLQARVMAETLLAAGECYTREGLALRGGDLAEMGLRGADIGRAQDKLLDAVIDGRAENTAASLRAWWEKSREN